MTTTQLPDDAWYALAPGDTIGRDLTAITALGRPVVLFRDLSGAVVALEDRCAHRPYPLSAGRLDGDVLRCGLCGFGYDTGGQCVAVPTQRRVPLGAAVTAYPTAESDGLVWVWFGEPGRSRLHRIPALPWLADPGWAGVGGEVTIAANFVLLHENLADVTQVPFVAPEISPGVLAQEPPPLQVVVTETTVMLSRDFDPAPLPAWQAALAAIPAGAALAVHQEGHFPSPAVWVDHWDAAGADGSAVRLRFTQLVTPVDASTSRLLWRVSRDFAVADAAATDTVTTMFAEYYARVAAALERSQRVIDTYGPGPEVNVNADVVGLKIREIVADLLDEQGTGRR